jgi:hypothetical protein
MRKFSILLTCCLIACALAALIHTKKSAREQEKTSLATNQIVNCAHGANCSHNHAAYGDSKTKLPTPKSPAVTLTHSLAKENKSISEVKAGDRLKLNFGDELLLDVRVRFTKASPANRRSVSMELTGRRGWVHWLQKADGSILGNILLKEGGKNIVYEYNGEEGNLVIQRITHQEFICSSGNTDKSVGLPTSDAPFEPAGPAGNIPLLNSLPGAEAVVYIDFDGEQVSGTRWNTLEGRPETIDAEPAGFDEARIREVWEEVAEDMRPFKINVTTDRAVFDAAAIGKRMMSIVTPTDTAVPGSGGVAFLDSFYDGNDDPCWTFNLSPSSCAQTISHEVGHTFGLEHDGLLGQPQQTEYHRGNGTWGPIMGAPFGLNVVSWSDGAYEGATNTNQDDIKIINDLSAEFRNDQYGDTDADGFDFAAGTFDETVDIEGVIETPEDVDVFTFTTSGGTITLNADPEGVDIDNQGFVTNMNIHLQVYNELGELVIEDDPGDSYGASITTELESGNYTFHVEGTNSGSPDDTGFSDYGSIGQYAVTGNIPGLGGDGDLTPPTADLLDPANGEIADLRLLNLQGYLEVTFTDIGQGIDPDSIDGNELDLSGSGLGDVALNGSVTPVIVGSRYRYGFTGAFVEGNVNVEFVAGSFADISDLANVNEAETESFSVDRLPFTEFTDDADNGFSATSGWNVYIGNSIINGYGADLTYAPPGDGSETVTWTFEGLDPGSYEVAITWHPRDIYRASNAPYFVYDGTTPEPVSSTRVDQSAEPSADYVKAGENFEIVFASVDISSNTLVVELSNDADNYVIADAVRIKQLEPSAPTADLINPSNGDSLSVVLFNARAYLDVTFSDIGKGIDPSTINGGELSLTGTGVNTANLAPEAPTLINGNTYRYSFTGEFIAGDVNVTFEADTFADLAETPNTNVEEVESFILTPNPPPTSLIVDDADPSFSATASWIVYPGNDTVNGYNNDFTYTQPGETPEPATWTFSGLIPGNYEVAITWQARDVYRASNAFYTVHDNTTQVSSNTVDQRLEPTMDYTEGGKPFQIVFASVNVSSGILVVELSNDADDYIVADAVRIKSLGSSGPDVTAPIADLTNPSDGDTIAASILNAQGFIEVSFTDIGDGIDHASITGNEISLSCTGAVGVTLSGTVERQATSNIYQYAFTGSFVDGDVNITIEAGSFADLADAPNTNIQEIESFTIADLPPPIAQLIDDGDDGFSIAEDWRIYPGNYLISGYNTSFTFSAPAANSTVAKTVKWTFNDIPAGSSYTVAITWRERDVYRASNATYKVYDGSDLLATKTVNQGEAPAQDHLEGREPFQIVFGSDETIEITSGTLIVELSNDADNYIIADAIRIEPVE